jgi:hypothetical protein
MAFRAVPLDAARGSGETSAGVALQGLIDRKGEIRVGACRDRSRLVVRHGIMITGSLHSLASYPQGGMKVWLGLRSCEVK